MTVRRTARSRRGAVLALAAVTVAALAAMSALAIDVGMLINARSEAQRAADAAALAGASAFRDLSPALAPSVGPCCRRFVLTVRLHSEKEHLAHMETGHTGGVS